MKKIFFTDTTRHQGDLARIKGALNTKKVMVMNGAGLSVSSGIAVKIK